MGRSARRNRREAAVDRRRIRLRSHPAVQLRGHHGAAERVGHGSPLLSPAGSVAARPHHLLERRDGGHDAGARDPLRHRARAVPAREAHHRVGREHPRHQRPPLAVYCRGAAQRSEALHDRSPPQPHRRRLRPAFFHPPGQRYRACPGDDARHHRRAPARCRLRLPIHRGVRDPGRPRARLDARTRRGADRHSARRDCRAGARVRHHAAGGDSPELRHPAQRARRDGGAHHRPAARAHRIVEGDRRRDPALHVAGVPPEPRRPWSAPTCSRFRSGARRGSSTCRGWATRSRSWTILR